jgi:ketosteroid isomerase-like protein
MKNVVRVALWGLGLMLLSCAGPAPHPATDDDWEHQVRAAEERHRNAFLVNDVAALDSMLADDFIVNSPQNRVIEKRELLGMVQGGVLAISGFEQEIEKVRRYGAIAVVMGEDRVVYAPPSPAAGRIDRRRFTDLWERRGDGWSFVARQATIVAP